MLCLIINHASFVMVSKASNSHLLAATAFNKRCGVCGKLSEKSRYAGAKLLGNLLVGFNCIELKNVLPSSPAT